MIRKIVTTCKYMNFRSSGSYFLTHGSTSKTKAKLSNTMLRRYGLTEEDLSLCRHYPNNAFSFNVPDLDNVRAAEIRSAELAAAEKSSQAASPVLEDEEDVQVVKNTKKRKNTSSSQEQQPTKSKRRDNKSKQIEEKTVDAGEEVVKQKAATIAFYPKSRQKDRPYIVVLADSSKIRFGLDDAFELGDVHGFNSQDVANATSHPGKPRVVGKSAPSRTSSLGKSGRAKSKSSKKNKSKQDEDVQAEDSDETEAPEKEDSEATDDEEDQDKNIEHDAKEQDEDEQKAGGESIPQIMVDYKPMNLRYDSKKKKFTLHYTTGKFKLEKFMRADTKFIKDNFVTEEDLAAAEARPDEVIWLNDCAPEEDASPDQPTSIIYRTKYTTKPFTLRFVSDKKLHFDKDDAEFAAEHGIRSEDVQKAMDQPSKYVYINGFENPLQNYDAPLFITYFVQDDGSVRYKTGTVDGTKHEFLLRADVVGIAAEKIDEAEARPGERIHLHGATTRSRANASKSDKPAMNERNVWQYAGGFCAQLSFVNLIARLTPAQLDTLWGLGKIINFKAVPVALRKMGIITKKISPKTFEFNRPGFFAVRAGPHCYSIDTHSNWIIDSDPCHPLPIRLCEDTHFQIREGYPVCSVYEILVSRH